MALGLKYNQGFTSLWPNSDYIFWYAGSDLSQAIEVLPIGTAYAVWTGIGAAGTIIGMYFLAIVVVFHE